MIDSLQEAQDWLTTNSQPRVDAKLFFKIANKNKWLPVKSKVITVAGTNGKGSTVACLEAILLGSGYRVASYTSPHLMSINERFKFNGVPMNHSQSLAAFNVILTEYQDSEINGFEFLTLVFLLLCQNESLDYIIIEVGIGGRHCITNLIEPDISVVTTINLDHTELLGATRDAVAYEKSGIFRSKKPAICGDANPPKSLLDYALKIRANLLIQGKNFSFSQGKETWKWKSEDVCLSELPLPNIPLQNASTALAALQFCQVPTSAIYQALANFSVPGRLQVVQQQPEVICDVAHNPESCEHLVQHLAKSEFAHNYGVLTMKANKDISAALQPLLALIDHWTIYALAGEEGFISKVSELFDEHHVKFTVCDSAMEAFKKGRAFATEDDRIIVFGSFQLVGAVLHHYAKS